MEEEPEILMLFEVQYDDLLLLAADPTLSSSSSLERQRLDSISSTIMETLGPTGRGLISVTGVPNSSILRRRLLLLARKLTLLNHEDRKRVLKEHRLGSDVPLKNVDRVVSSFAMKLEYSKRPKVEQEDIAADKEGLYDEFEDLGETFEQLGQLMVDLGIRLAQVCDMAIGGHELEQSLMESSTAKGRLIHYHSALDNLIIQQKEMGQPKHDSIRGVVFDANQTEQDFTALSTNPWQQWHYDYGIFTVLTYPMFMSSHGSLQTSKEGHGNEKEIESPEGHTCLQVLDTHMDKLVVVKSSPDSFIIQVGESADILSKGKLRATLHSVSRPRKLGYVSRETFVVFLQPAWSKMLVGDQSLTANVNHGTCRKQTQSNMVDDILSTIPPLSSRLKDGMTFC